MQFQPDGVKDVFVQGIGEMAVQRGDIPGDILLFHDLTACCDFPAACRAEKRTSLLSLTSLFSGGLAVSLSSIAHFWMRGKVKSVLMPDLLPISRPPTRSKRRFEAQIDCGLFDPLLRAEGCAPIDAAAETFQFSVRLQSVDVPRPL